VAVAIVTMAIVKVSAETNIPVTLMHGRRTHKSKVNLIALIGLRLRKERNVPDRPNTRMNC